jgi:hypothetical protein
VHRNDYTGYPKSWWFSCADGTYESRAVQ